MKKFALFLTILLTCVVGNVAASVAPEGSAADVLAEAGKSVSPAVADAAATALAELQVADKKEGEETTAGHGKKEDAEEQDEAEASEQEEAGE